MAGGWGTTFANDLIKLILLATAIANVADNATSSPLTTVHLGLHTASPSGTAQTTSEAAYTSYVRKSRTRDADGTTGWNVASATAALQALTSFAAGTGGGETVTHFSLGTASSGTGKIIFWGTVTPNIVTGNGVTPQLTTATMLTLGT